MKQFLLGICCLLMLLALPGAARGQAIELGAGTGGAKAVKDFVEAIRQGNAAKMRGMMAVPVSNVDKNYLSSWVDNVAMLGPKLPDSSFTEVTGSRIKGDVGVVIGGYGPPKPYTRVLRRQGQWKLMIGPEDVKSAFTLSAAEAATLKELDTWAAGQMASTPASARSDRTGQPPAAARRGGSTGRTAPARADSGKVSMVALIAPIADLLPAAIGKKDSINRYGDVMRCMRSLLLARDLQHAGALLQLVEPKNRSVLSGQVAAFLPRGAWGPDGARLLRESADQTQLGFWTGAAQGYALQGDVRGIDNARRSAESEQAGWQGIVLLQTLHVLPSEPAVSTAISMAPVDSLAFMLDIGRGFALVGKPQIAQRFLASQASARPGTMTPAQWELALKDAAEQCRKGISIGYAQNGEYDKARAGVEGEDRVMIDAEIAVHQALSGDAEGLNETLKSSGKLYFVEPLRGYVLALDGDNAAAQRAVDEEPLPDAKAWGYGLIANARSKKGDEAGARAAVLAGVEFVKALDEGVRTAALIQLLRGCVIGPEADRHAMD